MTKVAQVASSESGTLNIPSLIDLTSPNQSNLCHIYALSLKSFCSSKICLLREVWSWISLINILAPLCIGSTRTSLYSLASETKPFRIYGHETVMSSPDTILSFYLAKDLNIVDCLAFSFFRFENCAAKKSVQAQSRIWLLFMTVM